VLDNTQALGAVGVLRKQHDDLRAQEARLLAERDGAATVSFPDDLTARRSDSDVDTLLRAQENVFISRQTALAGQVSLLKQKVAQTREQITGSKAVLTSRQQQLESTRGEKIMDIVPDTKALAVEATVNVEDIEGVHPDMEAQVRLTAYTQRSTPSMRAHITQVSADRLTDSRSGQSYYAVQAKIPAEELAKQKNVKLFPGMPAMLVIPTGKRTVLDYLLKPLTESINKAMREK